MTTRHHVRGPYEDGGADDEAFQLAYYECTVADLIALAARRNVGETHVFGALTKGTRPRGKTSSMRMGGITWWWQLSLNGGQITKLSRIDPLVRVKITHLKRD